MLFGPYGYVEVDKALDITPDPRAKWVKIIATRKDDMWAAVELLEEAGWGFDDYECPDWSTDMWCAFLYRRNKHR